MPPRYAYWTILIDDTPTAFRAREREELQPTFVQLQRKNANVTMQWFARGKLWASREAERDDFQMQKHAASAPREPRDGRPADGPGGAEKRGSGWRPGGAHKDPRDRFKKKNRPERAWSEKDPATQRDRDKPGYAAKSRDRGDRPWQDRKPGGAQPFRPAGGERKPWRDKPTAPPRGDRPWSGKPRDKSDAAPGFSAARPRERKPWTDKPASGAPPSDRPWQTKPTGPRAQRKPWVGKPSGDRPWNNKPPGDGPRGDRPWRDKPAGDGKRPWSGKPSDRPGPPRERKPWTDKAAGGPPRGDRPWSKKPDGAQGFSPAKPRTDRPRQDKPHGKPAGGGSQRPWSSKPPAGGGSQRPWSSKPPAGGSGQRPWSGKPRDPNRKPFTPRGPRPGGAPGDRPPPKRRAR